MCDDKQAEFSLKVVMNKEKTKVLFAEVDNHFTDILLSFLTLPLGRIIKVLQEHCGDEKLTIGSLNSLYHSLANLDSPHFVTEDAKQTLLNPTSSFEEVLREATSGNGVFTIDLASFIIFDDLQIFPNETGLFGIISIVGIANMDKAEPIKVTLGFSEIMSLLKASLISQTPLSDTILSKTRGAKNSITLGFEPEDLLNQIENEQNPNSKMIIIKVVLQKSSGKLVYAQAKKDFIEFLSSFLYIPLGGVEHLLAGKTCVKAIDNLYRSTTDLIDCEFFKSPDMKNRLIKPDVARGCIPDNHIFPLQEKLTDGYVRFSFPSSKFPNGEGIHLEGPQTYQITDDLTVQPLCIFSILSNLNKQKIHVSDVKEVEMRIGLKEGLSILKASLTSTSALSDALLNNISIKQPKTEH